MSIKSRVQEIFDKFQVELKVSEPTKLATAKLESGQEIETDDDDFKVGSSVFVVNDEGERMPLPDGEYILEDGSAMMIADGVKIETPEKEKEAEAEEEVEVVATLSSDDVNALIADALKPIMEALQLQATEMDSFSKQAAEKSLPRVSKQPQKIEKVDLSNMNIKERVQALTNQYSN
tara:strand:- start:65 stop:595 length:531 start_codon:yes stop_codon:yes gene_type:complete